jgi:hypothetical protein
MLNGKSWPKRRCIAELRECYEALGETCPFSDAELVAMGQETLASKVWAIWGRIENEGAKGLQGARP